ncbi:uncharacterized protein LOC113780620 [Coffea eugenioides]|uniref:uncharacterized protein LOC113780620 n=1 Tax=Coffea eugenioides TaxID=49369 RepID=UPI000F60825A|nr:uncharacterized protein LOC113780620 [Coffea eugenioides]
MTYNPAWKEIQCNLKYHEKPLDRPDLLARVLRAKFEMLKHELLNRQIFGKVAACVYVIEFQKRGFPHAHLLLILKPQFKLLNPESYDKIVCAELPDRLQYPHLYSLVVKHMIHDPCGDMDKSCPCMKDGSCKNYYPKIFCPHTTHGEDSYPYYRRRDGGKKVKVRRFTLDNRWVVPYNPYLLALFDCHMNVEIFSTIKLVKYLYKYVFKGHDLVSFRIMTDDSATDTDEIKEFQKGRYISPPEAFWRIYEFRLNEMTPSVYTLQIHLPNQQLVSFSKNSDLLQLLAKVDFFRTMLIEFFKMNTTNATAENLKCFYKDFPQHFVWSSKYKHRTERKRRKVIGRLVSVNPREGERYYLRLLLNHIPGPISFEDLLTVHDKKMNSFREAALALGLLQSDTYIEETLEEATAFQMPFSLRLLFATLLVYCSPTGPTMLWKIFELDFSRDYLWHKQSHDHSPAEIRGLVLADINKSLQQMGTSIAAYQLPLDDLVSVDQVHLTKKIEAKRNIDIPPENLLMSLKLNSQQKYAYNKILKACFASQGHSFFIDGPGGTGKTFLYRSLLATLKSQGYIAIAVATSGIAASILPRGRTAHSRFKIPLDFSKNRTCQLSKQGSVAKLLSESKLILWDEASMAKRETIEAFNDLLRDIMESELPFGGKVIVFGGNFRQTLPVIEQATKEVLLQSCFLNSPLWYKLHKLKLTENMRVILDSQFSEFLLRVGEGREPVDLNSEITLSRDLVIPYYDKEKSLNRLLHSVFSDLTLYSQDPYSMINRCILTLKNNLVDELNDIMIRRFSGELHTYISSDKAIDQRHQGNYEDFLNSQNPTGLPSHRARASTELKILIVPGTFDGMSNLLPIGDIMPDMKNWSCIITIQEKQQVTDSMGTPTKKQKFVFYDSESSKVEGIIYNADIPRMSPMLQVITSKTVIEEVNGNEDIMPVKFSFTEFADLAEYMDDRSKSVGVALSTWFDSALLVDPSIQEARQLKNWCRFDVDLSDDSGVIPASIFGDLAENILTFTALEAIDHFNQNLKLPLEFVHAQIKTKTFLVHIKPVQTQLADARQRYTILYCSELEPEFGRAQLTGEPESVSLSTHQQTENEQLLMTGDGGSGSKVRLRLCQKFDEAETVDSNDFESSYANSKKKAKLG